MKPRYESGWVGLVEQILVGTADLHGALCADRPELWDPQLEGEDRELTDERHEAAARVCRRCPVIDECAAWAATTPGAGSIRAGRKQHHKPKKEQVQ